MKYAAIIQGQRLEIELNRNGQGVIEAEIDGRSYQLEGKAVEPGIYWLTWNNQSLQIGVTQNLDGYIVSLPGRRIEVRDLTKEFRSFRRREGVLGAIQNLFVREYVTIRAVDTLVVDRRYIEITFGS